ncbi:uncharacterized protein LOC131226271 isoform X2 [Magnolia sinica]|uniref:uncharacterized protein LOC131226271 isoform X2 n=1 Tax=Magnolia sinica TaxID=86752 RepID=UPI00265A3493|nr:uncharacterized protein LOC131226271 isoform X2 [Magnolia sinica]
MAPSQSHQVKSLNKSHGRRRFVFKNFAQRLEEIEIDVYRNLDTIKSEPSDGSSFFRESLLHWRELNTAEDFISFYEEMMPWVQTLPQILLQKETIVSKLICRLKMEAKLSLEPILRLIAALSRDLLEEFLPFMQRIADSLVDLLKNGGDREPDILEQVFTSWSYIMMYLQKYLVRDVVLVLKITIRLRYYPKDYVQEFMAEAISFLLRNAPNEQLIKGVRKIIFEVAKKPSSERKVGVSSLLWHVLRGTSSRLHSKAKKVLRLLIDSSTIGIGDKFTPGSDTVVEVITGAFQRLWEELDSEELNLVLNCLTEEILGCVSNRCFSYLSRLLSLLISTIQFSKGCKIFEYHSIVLSLIETVIMPSATNKMEEDYSSDVVSRTLQLMVCLLDILDDPSTLSRISLQWAPVFELRNSSLLPFIKGLLEKDSSILHAFRSYIISALSDLIEASPEEVLYLMLTFFERLQGKLQLSDGFDGVSEDKVSRICNFFQETICSWTRLISDIATASDQSIVHESNLSVLWGTVSCYPYIFGSRADLSLIMNLVNALDQLLTREAGFEKKIWLSLVGSALVSYHKSSSGRQSGLSETSNFLQLAKKYKSSAQVLCAVAEFLDSIFGDRTTWETHPSHNIFHPDLEVEKAVDAINIFADNLGLSDKAIRTSTLRILCHYKPIDCQLSTGDHHAQKKLKTEGSQQCAENSHCSNVIQILLAIEATPLSISTSRKVAVLISKIQMDLAADRISEAYAPVLLNGIIGIFHNRFSHLWEPATECLAVLLNKHAGLVWDRFVQYLGNLQVKYLASPGDHERSDSESSIKSSALGECFNSFVTLDTDSTPCTMVLVILLQSIQKVPAIAESRSRQLIPLFFKFLGSNDDDITSIRSVNWHSSKGKEWRVVLKEWLNLLKLMRNPKSLYGSQVLKEVMINRLLDETDSDIQLKVLDCLLNWKDDFLVPYNQHLKNLITSKNLREELTTWSLSKEYHHIQERHRGHLIPLVIRILMPKVRKLKTLSSRKHAGVSHRKAVLCFLSELDINELPLFFSLLLKHLQPAAYGSEGFENRFWSSCESFLDEFQASNFVRNFVEDTITNLSWKKRCGFLHVTEDILRTFDESHIEPFLNLLMIFVVRILESCTLSLINAKSSGSSLVGDDSTLDLPPHESFGATEDPIMTNTATKQFKDLRSFCLKIISFVLNKYENHDFGSQFWDIFFMSVKPLIAGFKQEGSSSEKPSSLFSCFVTMSRSPKLVLLLDCEKSLIPNIFSILTVKTASDAIITCVLNFIENLLHMDNDLEGHEDCTVKRIILPHIDELIISLHTLFHCHKVTQRKSAMWPGKTELRIFKLLVKYIKDPLEARKFVDIMLPLLARKALDSDECVEGLHIIQGILPILGCESISQILNAVYPLLLSAGLNIRLSICDILDGLSVTDPSLDFLAKLLRELNATSVSEIGEFDYDTRVNAYEAITLNFFSSLKEGHALVILSHCVYDMSSGELILRQSASRALLSFILFAASILEREKMGCQDMQLHDETRALMMPIATGTFNANRSWTEACIQRLINKFFLLHMGEAMSKEMSVQKEWISLLRDMVWNFPGIPALNSYRPLCSDDAEVDFFNNILHLQKHRRARALSRFRNVITAGNFSERITMKVFVPLFFNMMFDVKEGKGEHVRDACLETLASISGCMQWDSYHTFLMRCFREMTLKPDKRKVLLRLICSILDRFHFSETDCSQDREDNLCEVSDTNIVKGSSATVLACSFTSRIPTEIQASLQKTVLPQIQKLLTSDTERVNVTSSLASLKLLKLLPLDTLESQLPSIIHRISNFLKNRLESIRDEARSALAACLQELGLEYLQFIIKVLRATLKRGYELHVLGYTLHFILSKALSNTSVGKLDYCLEEVLSVVENDIIGGVAEEKEVEKIASKMKETRKTKSFDTLKLISQSVTFKTHASKLFSPIQAHLQKHLTQKVKVKLETMLHHIAAGIECNPSVDQIDLFIFIYGLIEDVITEVNLKEKNKLMTKTDKLWNNETIKEGNPGKVVSGEFRSSHLIGVFALGVLHNRLKNMKLDKKDDQLLSLLDPFVGLLGKCLSSKYEDVLSVALKCLAPLIRLPLPSLEVQADKIKTLLLDFAQKSVTTSSPLMESCLKLLTVLLRSTRISLSSDQLHMLIQFPLFLDLETNPSFVALSLLKAIIGRKLVVPEIYDVVTRVAELMITSQLEPIRKKCSQILLQFLLDYQLSDKRLQQHLDFLLANLSYEHPSGREAVLEMIHAILIKFPKSVVDSQAQTFFLHLVVCLANDSDSKVRSMVGAAIKLLIGRTSQHALHPILQYNLSWYVDEKPHLWSAAAQVLGLLVEVLGKEFQRHINKIIQVAHNIMMSALDKAMNNEVSNSNEATIPFWREAYYSLVMLEKMLHQYPELYLQKDLQGIWEAICKFLLYPHMWLRNISSRLVASYFAVVTQARSLDQGKLDLGFSLMKPSSLFAIAVSLCCQLKSQLTDDASGNIITQNLVFAVCGLHSFARQRECTDPHVFWSTLELHERDHFCKAFELLGSRKAIVMFQSVSSNDPSGNLIVNDQNKSENLPSLLVAPLLRRMGKLALQKEDIQLKVVFSCFKMISSQIGSEGCHDYAFHMLLPLYKVCEGFAGKVTTDEVKQLAEDVRDNIKRILGVEKYVQVYNMIRKNLKAKRDKRRQEEKLMAVVNPMRNAKRKLRIAAKHRANKRRKIMTMKMGRRW